VFVPFIDINVSIDAVVLLAVRYAWTAGRRLNDTDFVWKVVTSKTYGELPMDFTNWWVTGAPSNFKEEHFCMALYRAFNFNWYDHWCTLRHSAVCEIDIA